MKKYQQVVLWIVGILCIGPFLLELVVLFTKSPEALDAKNPRQALLLGRCSGILLVTGVLSFCALRWNYLRIAVIGSLSTLLAWDLLLEPIYKFRFELPINFISLIIECVVIIFIIVSLKQRNIQPSTPVNIRGGDR
jgi:hypothetical protein